MINYGVVGVGYFGAELARFMNMHDNAKITCVYDPENGENIARELQCINTFIEIETRALERSN